MLVERVSVGVSEMVSTAHAPVSHDADLSHSKYNRQSSAHNKSFLAADTAEGKENTEEEAAIQAVSAQ